LVKAYVYTKISSIGISGRLFSHLLLCWYEIWFNFGIRLSNSNRNRSI